MMSGAFVMLAGKPGTYSAAHITEWSARIVAMEKDFAKLARKVKKPSKRK